MKFNAVLVLIVTVLATTSSNASAGDKGPPDHQYRDLRTTGTASVDGRAAVVDRYSRELAVGESIVLLTPETDHAKKWLGKTAKGEGLSSCAEALGAFAFTAITDLDGRFEIQGVPPGEYILAAWVKWQAPYYVSPYGLLDSDLTIVKRYKKFVLTCDIRKLHDYYGGGQYTLGEFVEYARAKIINKNPRRTVLLLKRVAIAEDGQHITVNLTKRHRGWDPVEYGVDEYCKVLHEFLD